MTDKNKGEFKAITTQEELNEVIGDRLKRAKEKAVEPFADYDQLKKDKSDLEEQVKKLNESITTYKTTETENKKTINDLNDQVKKYENQILRDKIAREKNLPLEFADRLRGDTEDDLREDAESLSKLVKAQQVPPLKDTEEASMGEKDAAMRSLLQGLKGE